MKIKRGIIMKIVEKQCENCGKGIYVLKEYVRKDMFCTLGCMNQYNKNGMER